MSAVVTVTPVVAIAPPARALMVAISVPPATRPTCCTPDAALHEQRTGGIGRKSGQVSDHQQGLLAASALGAAPRVHEVGAFEMRLAEHGAFEMRPYEEGGALRDAPS